MNRVSGQRVGRVLLDIVCFGHLLGASLRRGDARSAGTYAGHLVRCLFVATYLGVNTDDAREFARIAMCSGKQGDIA